MASPSLERRFAFHPTTADERAVGAPKILEHRRCRRARERIARDGETRRSSSQIAHCGIAADDVLAVRQRDVRARHEPGAGAGRQPPRDAARRRRPRSAERVSDPVRRSDETRLLRAVAQRPPDLADHDVEVGVG